MQWPRVSIRYVWCLLGVLLLAAHAPGLIAHGKAAANPDCFTDDAAQHVAPYLRYMENGPRGDDLVADYFEALHPIGYRALYRAWAAIGDPRDLSRGLPYVLLPLFLAGMAWAGYRLAGPAGALAAGALCLSTDLFFPRMVGGLPRSFGFPVLALGLAAQLAGRWRCAAAALLAAAVTYPAAAVPLGLALAFNRLTPLLAAPIDRRVWLRRFAELGAVAATGALLLLPTLLAARPYGPSIGPHDLADFPEAQAHGRLRPADRVDYTQPVPAALASALPKALNQGTAPWHAGAAPWLRRHGATLYLVLNAITAIGWLLALRHSVPARRLLAFLVAVLLSYGAARLLAPNLFLPERHLAYPLPIVALLAFITALCAFAGPAACAARRPRAAILVLGLPLLLAACLGGTLSPRSGFPPPAKGQESLGQFLATLPSDVHLAGWPKILDRLRYRCARRVLMTHETNLPYHAAYTRALRERMQALTQAIYATRPEHTEALQARYGVTHLVIDRRYLHVPHQTYRPYAEAVIDALVGYAPAESLWLRHTNRAVYADERYLVFDLATQNL